MTTVTRMRLLACGRGSVDVIPCHDDEPAASGHEPPWIRPLHHHENNYFIRDRG
jgi:hypothetical protein